MSASFIEASSELCSVDTYPKETFGAPDQMTVSQQSNSEGWHPSDLLCTSVDTSPKEASWGPSPDDRQPTQQVRGMTPLWLAVYFCGHIPQQGSTWAPDRMRVIQHSKSEGWQPSDLLCTSVDTSPKEALRTPDRMTVSQHSKSEGWHPSVLLCSVNLCRHIPQGSKLGPLTRWPSANTASQRGDTPLTFCVPLWTHPPRNLSVGAPD
jgi:hypothetical protein